MVASATQRDKLREYLRDTHGFATDDLTKATVETAMRGALDPEVRELLEIRQQASATSPAKYRALLDAASSDGRLRGTVQFCGAARTGRDAGRLFQPQNLPRTPDWFDGEVQELTISAFKAGVEELLWDNISERCAMSVRGSLLASTGMKLAIADLSNIEGRVLAWLAGEDWKIEAFKAYDAGTGPDLYKATAARILQKEVADITKDERQSMGKVPELACLGPDTLVLTDNGVKPITKVELEDRLWDGLLWVKHDGLIDRGEKTVLSIDGVEMTGDHQVLVDAIWQPAQTVASCPSCRAQALETGSESLRSLALLWGREAVSGLCTSAVLAGGRPTAFMSAICDGEPAPGATPVPNRPAGGEPSNGIATPKFAPTMAIAGGSAIASQLASIGVTIRKTRPSSTTGGGASTSMSLGEQTDALFSRIWSNLKGGIDESLSLTELTLTGAMCREISASSDGELTVTTCDASQFYKRVSPSLRRVYDIANAGPRSRFTVLTDSGALLVHNCGYQGAVGAFRQMGGATVDSLSDEQIDTIVQGWRRANRRIQSFWYDVERAALGALRNPAITTEVSGLRFAVKRCPRGVDWLTIRLPSGRYLCYPNAREGWQNPKTGEVPAIAYDGLNQYTRKWETLGTYGGKLVENIVQAVARDVFMTGLRRAEEAGYAVVLRVHDELVCEVPDDPAFTDKALADMMATNPGWATGLPLAAAGFETYRYRKE